MGGKIKELRLVGHDKRGVQHCLHYFNNVASIKVVDAQCVTASSSTSKSMIQEISSAICPVAYIQLSRVNVYAVMRAGCSKCHNENVPFFDTLKNKGCNLDTITALEANI